MGALAEVFLWVGRYRQRLAERNQERDCDLAFPLCSEEKGQSALTPAWLSGSWEGNKNPADIHREVAFGMWKWMTTCLPSPQQIVKTPCRSGCWRLARPKQTRRSSSHRLTASAPSVLSLPSATSLSSLICNNRWIIELAFIMRLTKLHRGRTGRKKKHRTMGQPPQKKKSTKSFGYWKKEIWVKQHYRKTA